MSSLKQNVLANFAASLWASVMGLAFVPFYLHFLGVEAYGLMGVFATLQSMVSLLDMGLGSTLNRELARLSVRQDSAHEMRNLVRTLEVLYWAVGILIGVLVLLITPLVTRHWVNTVSLEPTVVRQSMLLMGLSFIFQWPLGLYSGGLLGLQRQVILSCINGVIATARAAGGVLVLWQISATMQAFFTWQIIVSVISTFVVAVVLWRNLPPCTDPVGFDRYSLWRVWRYAAGLSGISVTVLVLTQIDKVLLSRLLTLEAFGYYTLAWAIAGNLYRVINPTFTAAFPRLAQLVACSDAETLKRFYHQSCQFVSVTFLPAAVIAMIFSHDILSIWIRDSHTVERTYLIMTIVLIGTTLNGLMYMPYALQLAYGWTHLALYTNIVSILVLVPLFVVLTHLYGAMGGAIAWAALNVGYVSIQIHLMHRRILCDEKWQWYLEDIGRPLVAVGAVGVLGRFAISGHTWPPLLVAALASVSLLAFGAAVLAVPWTRAWLMMRICPVPAAASVRET